jgi:hypothetical protein
MNEFQSKVQHSLNRLEKWVEDHQYQAYEPFDGLSSPLRVFTFGHVFLDRLLMQAIRSCPVNLRPLFLVRPLPSTKGRGYMAAGYLNRYRLEKDQSYQTRAFAMLDWLDKHKSPKYPDHSWANHFAFASRGGRYPKHESIIVWTALIGQAYLEAWEQFREPRHLEVIRSICRWILALPREKTATGTCISYLMPITSSIHNSNMLGAAFLARAAKATGDRSMLAVAAEAMLYSCSRQCADGAWNYGEDSKYHWIDNFHTGYNLDSLRCYIAQSGDTSFQPNLDKGFTFFKEHFFLPDGCPRYYHDKTYPVDSQCAAQAIETLASFADTDPQALQLCRTVTSWWIDNMQDRDGHFYFRQYQNGIKDKTPMLHWAQATTYKALTMVLRRLQEQKGV